MYIYIHIHMIVTYIYIYYMYTIHNYMCIQLYTYVISYLLKQLPSYSLLAIYIFKSLFQHHHSSWGLGYECPHLCKCLCQLKRLNLSAILSAQPSLSSSCVFSFSSNIFVYSSSIFPYSSFIFPYSSYIPRVATHT